METKKVLTRDNEPTQELHEYTTRIHKGIQLQYEEVYYLDYQLMKRRVTLIKQAWLNITLKVSGA